MDGVLPSQVLRQMIARGQIAAPAPILADQVQPASLDLRLGEVAWRVRASFLSGPQHDFADRLADFQMHRIDLAGGAVLEKGCVYVVKLVEHLTLPPDVHAVANARSSIGRLDLLTRTITDRGAAFDRIACGYCGPLYAEICPRSFSVLVRPGLRLNQVRFRRGQSRLSDAALAALHAQTPLADGNAQIANGLVFSVDLRPLRGDWVGYRAKPHTGVIDLGRMAAYDVAAYWEAVRPFDGHIILDPGAFYILVSREAVRIPPQCAAEMAPYLAMMGEFRVHYAGFFDPGFGDAATGGRLSRSVLEVRCHEAPFALEHGQAVGLLQYERMAQVPDRLYGAGAGAHYQGQGLKLSRHFREP
ncbi:MAG: 2'-deoxycytidine 5'-triphosphate deaminase [Rhodobacteraceae bacterium]|nr:2'-deoxycytidine 5'-triphosphate deaminase [Paracoccaceae bacterium]